MKLLLPTLLISLSLFAETTMAAMIYQDLHLVPMLQKSHGTIMSAAFVLVFPLGILSIRVLRFKGAIWVHAACQLIGWVLMIAGLAMGIRMARIIDIVSQFARPDCTSTTAEGDVAS